MEGGWVGAWAGGLTAEGWRAGRSTRGAAALQGRAAAAASQPAGLQAPPRRPHQPPADAPSRHRPSRRPQQAPTPSPAAHHGGEGVVGVAVHAVQRPGHLAVQLLQVAASRLRHVPHDAVHQLGLGKPVLALLCLAGWGGGRVSTRWVGGGWVPAGRAAARLVSSERAAGSSAAGSSGSGGGGGSAHQERSAAAGGRGVGEPGVRRRQAAGAWQAAPGGRRQAAAARQRRQQQPRTARSSGLTRRLDRSM